MRAFPYKILGLIIKIADRLAVRRASGFVDKTLEPFLICANTASNNYLYKLLKELIHKERKDYIQKCFKTKFESRYTYCMGNRRKHEFKRSNGRIVSNRFSINKKGF